MQSTFTVIEGRFLALLMTIMSLGVLLVSRYYRQKIEASQRKMRLWILQELHQSESLQTTLQKRLPHMGCHACQLSLLEAIDWLEAREYITLKNGTYLLTDRGQNHLNSKEADPNFAKPGWVRLLGHIHPLL